MPILANDRLMKQVQRRLDRDFYSDTALLVIKTATGAYDALNNPIVTTVQAQIKCSYTDKPNVEQWLALGDVSVIVSEIRYAGPKPTKGNQVIITSRFGGQPLPAQTLEVYGVADRAALGFVCALKAVEL